MSVRKRRWKTSKGEQREAWIVDYTDGEGDRALETFDKKRDAAAFHVRAKVEVERGDHITPSKSETVAAAGERWIKRVEAAGSERTTVLQYREHLKLHIAPRLGGVKLAHLTEKRLENFRDDLLQSLSAGAGAQGDDEP